MPMVAQQRHNVIILHQRNTNKQRLTFAVSRCQRAGERTRTDDNHVGEILWRVQRSRFGSDASLPVIKITVHRLAA